MLVQGCCILKPGHGVIKVEDLAVVYPVGIFRVVVYSIVVVRFEKGSLL